LSRPQLHSWQETFDALIAEEMSSVPVWTGDPPATGDSEPQSRQFPPQMPSVLASENDDLGSLFRPRPKRDPTRTTQPTTGSGYGLEQQPGRGDELDENTSARWRAVSIPTNAAPERRSRRVPTPRAPVTLPARFPPTRVRPRGTRKRNLKRLDFWDMRIRYPRNAVSCCDEIWTLLIHNRPITMNEEPLYSKVLIAEGLTGWCFRLLEVESSQPHTPSSRRP
jgi:hypothetical protein